MAGKGSKRRPYKKSKFDHNFDQIDWSSTETVPELSAMQMDQLLDEVRKVFKEPENAKPKRSR